MKIFLESCCTSCESVKAACEAGASRIELCERLEVGGVTPSRSLLKSALALSTVPVNVLVRPRGGNFCYDEAEIALMLEDVRFCAEAGAAGVVIGALREDGSVDMETMTRLCACARECGLTVTFHRAFDECAEPLKAFEDIIALGCDRLLTSGHEATAYEGRAFIGELVRRARGRIIVMAGCGVRPENIKEIQKSTAAPEYHSSRILPFAAVI